MRKRKPFGTIHGNRPITSRRKRLQASSSPSTSTFETPSVDQYQESQPSSGSFSGRPPLHGEVSSYSEFPETSNWKRSVKARLRKKRCSSAEHPAVARDKENNVIISDPPSSGSINYNPSQKSITPKINNCLKKEQSKISKSSSSSGSVIRRKNDISSNSVLTLSKKGAYSSGYVKGTTCISGYFQKEIPLDSDSSLCHKSPSSFSAGKGEHILSVATTSSDKSKRCSGEKKVYNKREKISQLSNKTSLSGNDAKARILLTGRQRTKKLDTSMDSSSNNESSSAYTGIYSDSLAKSKTNTPCLYKQKGGFETCSGDGRSCASSMGSFIRGGAKSNGDDRPLITKGMMERARTSDIDNTDAFEAILNTKGARKIDKTARSYLSHSLLVGETVGSELRRSNSADYSEVTMPTHRINRIRQEKRGKRNALLAPQSTDGGGSKYSDSNQSSIFRKNIEQNRGQEDEEHNEQNDSSRSRPVSSSDEYSTRHTSSSSGPGITLQSSQKQSQAEPSVYRAPDGTLVHDPTLPSGWAVRISRSKNRHFYCHPDYGTTWHCPVVIPLKCPSTIYRKDETKPFGTRGLYGSGVTGQLSGSFWHDGNSNTNKKLSEHSECTYDTKNLYSKEPKSKTTQDTKKDGTEDLWGVPLNDQAIATNNPTCSSLSSRENSVSPCKSDVKEKPKKNQSKSKSTNKSLSKITAFQDQGILRNALRHDAGSAKPQVSLAEISKKMEYHDQQLHSSPLSQDYSLPVSGRRDEQQNDEAVFSKTGKQTVCKETTPSPDDCGYGSKSKGKEPQFESEQMSPSSTDFQSERSVTSKNAAVQGGGSRDIEGQQSLVQEDEIDFVTNSHCGNNLNTSVGEDHSIESDGASATFYSRHDNLPCRKHGCNYDRNESDECDTLSIEEEDLSSLGSVRIKNPPHPLCSLQNLGGIFRRKYSKVPNKKAPKTGKF